MPVDQELLEILACPNCKTKVELVKNGTALKCGQCKRVYPIKDDIPVMLIDEATIEPWFSAGLRDPRPGVRDPGCGIRLADEFGVPAFIGSRIPDPGFRTPGHWRYYVLDYGSSATWFSRRRSHGR